MITREGIKRVKRLTCKDCCYSEGNICMQGCLQLAHNRNGCLILPPPHFTLRRHRYRPGFMELRQEKSGEIWVYYNFDEEQRYDSAWHPSCGRLSQEHGGR